MWRVTHQHPRVIDNSTGFRNKLRRLFAEVCAVLGDPIPLEKEDKYVIAFFDPSVIPVPHYSAEITQQYLITPDPKEERRVRARGDRDGFTYYYTIKEEMSKGIRTEREEIIGEHEYRTLLSLRDSKLKTIRKQRISFFWNERYFEIDIFTAPKVHKGLVLMELERSGRRKKLILPPFLEMVRDVTGDKRYGNRSLASGIALT